jgi:dipeptidyl aminopeptidase/acylaminoacyl peptidase
VDKQPIAKAVVTVDTHEVQTDALGEFSIADVLPGTKVIRITKETYLVRNTEISGLYNTEVGDLYLIPEVLAVFEYNVDGETAIYQTYVDGSGFTKMFENKKGFDDRSALISPSKRLLTFASNREGKEDDEGNIQEALYLNSTTGYDLQKVNDRFGEVSWADDSESFFYLINNEDSYVINQYLVDTNGNSVILDERKLENKLVSGSAAAISNLEVAAREKLIFKVLNPADKENEGIFKVNFDKTGLTRLTGKTPTTFSLTRGRDKIRFVYVEGGTKKQYEIDIDTGAETEITLPARTGQQIETYFSWSEKYSPDEKTKAYVDYRDGKNDLFLSDLNDSNERRLSQSGGVVEYDFIGRGRYLVFSVKTPTESALYAVGLLEGNLPIKVMDIGDYVGVVE